MWGRVAFGLQSGWILNNFQPPYTCFLAGKRNPEISKSDVAL
jgi:hypothetical protein